MPLGLTPPLPDSPSLLDSSSLLDSTSSLAGFDIVAAGIRHRRRWT